MIDFSKLYTKNLLPSQTLLSHSPNEKDSYGETALSYIVRQCQKDPIESLVKAANIIGIGANISQPDSYGVAPLYRAVTNKCDIEMVKLLHRAGGNLTDVAEDSSYHSGLSNEVAKYLIEKTPDNIEIFCGSASAAATFCDKKTFNQSVHKAYVKTCLSPAVIKGDDGNWLPANKVNTMIFHPMVGASISDRKCHYDIDPSQDKLSFLTEYALRSHFDFENNYSGCAEALGGNVIVVHEGDVC